MGAKTGANGNCFLLGRGRSCQQTSPKPGPVQAILGTERAQPHPLAFQPLIVTTFLLSSLLSVLQPHHDIHPYWHCPRLQFYAKSKRRGLGARLGSVPPLSLHSFDYALSLFSSSSSPNTPRLYSQPSRVCFLFPSFLFFFFPLSHLP